MAGPSGSQLCWDGADSGEDPRRSSQRTEAEMRVMLVDLDDFDRPVRVRRVRAVDITQAGIGLRIDKPPRVGSRVLICLHKRGAGKGKGMTLGGIIRYCSARPVEQNFHGVGVQFVARDQMTAAFTNYDTWSKAA